jgi:hypothetical protein
MMHGATSAADRRGIAQRDLVAAEHAKRACFALAGYQSSRVECRHNDWLMMGG